DELLLPLDAGQVALGLEMPAAVGEILVVPGSHEPQSLVTGERVATGRRDIEARHDVFGPGGEVLLDPADGADDLAERVEVDLHIMVNLDPEILLNGLDQQIRP